MIPTATRALLIANVAIFLLQQVTGDALLGSFALWPLGAEAAGGAPFEVWQLVSYSFLHDGVLHLLFNMFALWMFGTDVERVVGPRRFTIFYFVCVVSAGLCQLLVSALLADTATPVIGASGGVFGVLLAFAMYFPKRIIMLLFPPIPLPAWLFVTGYALLELYFGVTGSEAGVAHFAHLGGMVGGYFMIRQWQTRRRL
jgi:membrane associated rhomboid family serine protease